MEEIIAAPLDAQRLGKHTPCTKLGHCIDCKSPDRICNTFACITRQFDKERIRVILIDGNFGYQTTQKTNYSTRT